MNSSALEGYELKCSEGLTVVRQCQLLLVFFTNIVFEDLWYPSQGHYGFHSFPVVD